VFEFDPGDELGGGLILVQDGQAGLPGTGIDLGNERLGVAALAVDQANREGVHLVYPGAAPCEQKSCSLFNAWHRRFLIFWRERIGTCCAPFCDNALTGLGDAPPALANSRHLPSKMLRTCDLPQTVSCLT
jgi:hypothetical protein